MFNDRPLFLITLSYFPDSLPTAGLVSGMWKTPLALHGSCQQRVMSVISSQAQVLTLTEDGASRHMIGQLKTNLPSHWSKVRCIISLEEGGGVEPILTISYFVAFQDNFRA